MVLKVVFIFLKTLEFTYLEIFFFEVPVQKFDPLIFVLFTPIFICSFTLSLLISWNYFLVLKVSFLLSICVKNKFLPFTLLKKI